MTPPFWDWFLLSVAFNLIFWAGWWWRGFNSRRRLRKKLLQFVDPKKPIRTICW